MTKASLRFAAQGVIDKIWRRSAGSRGSSAWVLQIPVWWSPGYGAIPAIMVNSGKALAYVPDMCGAVTFGSVQFRNVWK